MPAAPHESRRRLRVEHAMLAVTDALLLAFLSVPFVALVASTSGSDFAAGLRHPLVWPALRLSLLTTAVSLLLVVLFGTPLAWLLARGRGRLTRALETVVELPIVVPPAVAGVA